ncbi:MAG: hypothetical protein HY757_09575 [Nitrospirae bacterium]|nr:hypothetical protein [Nitrospirota bacterium]
MIYDFNVGAGSKPALVDYGITYQPGKNRAGLEPAPTNHNDTYQTTENRAGLEPAPTI